MDAHVKVEIVLNADEENEDEKRFNEIICYDSGDSDVEGEATGCEQYDTTASNGDISLQNSLKNHGNSSLDELDPAGRDAETRLERFVKRSNAAQMREYRARQRSDPVRYRQYLERERMRNYKRKYERRVEVAQERAQALGIPYVVIEQPNARRGRKQKSSGTSLVLPSNFDAFDIEDKSLWYDSDDMPMVPVEVELRESDNVYQNESPQISVVNINKLIAQPRSALQTLLPQEVNDRERINNSIKLEHDYVKPQQQISLHDSEARKQFAKTKLKRDKIELLKLQKQCRSYISKRPSGGSLPKSKRNHRQPKTHAPQPKTNFVGNNRVKHEDLDDLFKELAEVATKKSSKKRHASPHKKSPRKHSAREQLFFQEVKPRDAGEFSLTVSMPVQPIAVSTPKSIKVEDELKSIKIKEEPKSPASPWMGDEADDYKSSTIPSDNHLQSLNKGRCNSDDGYVNRNSIEIKQEPIHSDDDFW